MLMKYAVAAGLAALSVFPIAALAQKAPVQSQQANPVSQPPIAPNFAEIILRGQDGSHIMGNPDAPIKIAEYISYTCGHCATFEKKSKDALADKYVQTGLVSVEIRHFVRDPIDGMIALIANCGNPDDFFKRHSALMAKQSNIRARVEAVDRVKLEAWAKNMSNLAGLAALLNLEQDAQALGVAPEATQQCLTDAGLLARLQQQTASARTLKIPGTPSITVNGTFVDGTHTWESLEAVIKARLAAAPYTH